MNNPLELIWVGLATLGFAVLFDLKLRDAPLALAGAILGWFVYRLVEAASDEATAFFIAAAVIGIISEIGAIILKRPAFIYIVTAILPLVPGSGMYRTMLESVHGNLQTSLNAGFATVQSAGAIAAGLAVSSVLARLFSATKFGQKLRRGNFGNMHLRIGHFAHRNPEKTGKPGTELNSARAGGSPGGLDSNKSGDRAPQQPPSGGAG